MKALPNLTFVIEGDEPRDEDVDREGSEAEGEGGDEDGGQAKQEYAIVQYDPKDFISEMQKFSMQD